MPLNPDVASAKQYVTEELLHELGDRLTTRNMFGGVGLYLDGRIFGVIISDGVICFKVGSNNRADFQAAGSKPFVYTGHKNKKPVNMPYWSLPDEILEDPKKAVTWAEKSAENSVPKN